MLDGSSYLIVEFYDKNENYLGQFESDYILDDGTRHTAVFYDVPGNVEYYDLISYEVYGFNGTAEIICWILAFFVFLFLIDALTLKYKLYHINGKEVIVYAGVYHHYIKIDGIIGDENNSLVSYVPIYLNCALDDQNLLQVRITNFNSISLQCNNMLVQPE